MHQVYLNKCATCGKKVSPDLHGYWVMNDSDTLAIDALALCEAHSKNLPPRYKRFEQDDVATSTEAVTVISNQANSH